MIGFLAALASVFIGLVFNSQLLIVFGLIAFLVQTVLSYFSRPTPVSQAAPQRRRTHKLIDAPEDAWEVPEDSIWMAMMSGPSPMSIGGQTDFMNIATSGIGNPHNAGVIRGMLPFPNYGRQGPLGAVENIFIGFPISLGNFFGRPRR